MFTFAPTHGFYVGARDQTQALLLVQHTLYSLHNLPRPNMLFSFHLFLKGYMCIAIELTLLDLHSHFNMMLILRENLSTFSHYAILVPVRSSDIALVQRLQNGWASECLGSVLA